MALFCSALHSQNDSIEMKRQVVVYSFFWNIVPDQFRFPLIGFVNVATGNYQGFQMGFVNTTLKDFKGAQMGFVNTNLQNVDGMQMGFVNMARNKLSGFQMGFVNTALKETNGFQMGFVNTTLKEMDGFQMGFVNLARKGIKGNQIGFVNYADTITGIPIGFVSIVKKGGYRALEVSINEFYPVNLAFKIGIPKFYSFIQSGYNSDFKNKFALGGGFGSLFPMKNNFYFNPEISISQPLGRGNSQQFLALAGNFRYRLGANFQIALGPSVVWEHSDKKGGLYEPIYSIINQKIDDRNHLLIGARAALSLDL